MAEEKQGGDCCHEDARASHESETSICIIIKSDDPEKLRIAQRFIACCKGEGKGDCC